MRHRFTGKGQRIAESDTLLRQYSPLELVAHSADTFAMKLLLGILAGVCVWLLIERQDLIAQNERAALEEDGRAGSSGNWVQERIKGTPRMLDEKPKSVNRRERRAVPYSVQPATNLVP